MPTGETAQTHWRKLMPGFRWPTCGWRRETAQDWARLPPLAIAACSAVRRRFGPLGIIMAFRSEATVEHRSTCASADAGPAVPPVSSDSFKARKTAVRRRTRRRKSTIQRGVQQSDRIAGRLLSPAAGSTCPAAAAWSPSAATAAPRGCTRRRQTARLRVRIAPIGARSYGTQTPNILTEVKNGTLPFLAYF